MTQLTNSDDPLEVSCDEVLGELYLYLDAECDVSATARIKKHLSECGSCLQQYGIDHEVKALVARCCGNDSAPAGLRERLRIKIHQLVSVETTSFERR